jgi:hypothetical protein
MVVNLLYQMHDSRSALTDGCMFETFLLLPWVMLYEVDNQKSTHFFCHFMIIVDK